MSKNTPKHYEIFRNEGGVALIDFAVLFPVFLLVLIAIMEFGWFFLRYETMERAVSSISGKLINSSAAVTQATANGSGLGVIPFGTQDNYFCANSYRTLSEAESGLCVSGVWNVAAPSGVGASAPYYVALVANAQNNSLTPLAYAVMPKGTTITQTLIVTLTNNPPIAGGGSYTVRDGTAWNSTCHTTYPNPVTNACSCAPGYAAYGDIGNNKPDSKKFLCLPCGTSPALELHCF